MLLMLPHVVYLFTSLGPWTTKEQPTWTTRQRARRVELLVLLSTLAFSIQHGAAVVRTHIDACETMLVRRRGGYHLSCEYIYRTRYRIDAANDNALNAENNMVFVTTLYIAGAATTACIAISSK